MIVVLTTERSQAMSLSSGSDEVLPKNRSGHSSQPCSCVDVQSECALIKID